MMFNQIDYKTKLFKNKLMTALLLITCSNLPFQSTAATSVITDIDVNALITEAIETHPLVGSAQAEQQATTEGITAAKLNFLPTPSVTAGYDRDNDFVTDLAIRQPLWTGGQLTANVNQAIFDDKAAIENIYEQQNQVAKTTIQAWQSYIAAVAQQRVYLENLDQLKEFEAMMQRRVNQGVSARIELDLVTNRILQEQNAYQAATEQEYIAISRLEQITGHRISEGSAYTVPKLKVLVDQAKLQSVGFERMAFNQASFYNPAVIKEYFQIESAKQAVKASRAVRYPSLYAEYEHSYYKDDQKDNDGRFSLGLSYQPGAGFSNFALTRASEARVSSLIENQEAARRNVMENIQVQYQQFASAKSRELSLVAAVAGAQIVVNSYRRQFIAGRKSWLEVLNAVRELSGYQIQLVQTRSEILGSFYLLQVDFGLMPWQKFSINRDPVKMFNIADPVKNWLHSNNNLAASRNMGYTTQMDDIDAVPDSQFAYDPMPVVTSLDQEDILEPADLFEDERELDEQLEEELLDEALEEEVTELDRSQVIEDTTGNPDHDNSEFEQFLMDIEDGRSTDVTANAPIDKTTSQIGATINIATIKGKTADSHLSIAKGTEQGASAMSTIDFKDIESEANDTNELGQNTVKSKLLNSDSYNSDAIAFELIETNTFQFDDFELELLELDVFGMIATDRNA